MKDKYFYVIYDLYDDIKFLCNNTDEFISLTGFPKRNINNRFIKNFNKGHNYISIIIDDRFYKCYRYLKDEI